MDDTCIKNRNPFSKFRQTARRGYCRSGLTNRYYETPPPPPLEQILSFVIRAILTEQLGLKRQ